MRDWQKLAVAGIAAIGAAVAATPASAAPAGLQTLELATSSVDRPEVLLVDRRHGGRRIFRHRGHRGFRGHGFHGDDDGINLSFGVFPGYGYGGYGYGGYGYGYGHPGYYGSRYYYSDYDRDDSWLHCHGKKWRKYGRTRCRGKWHRHYN